MWSNEDEDHMAFEVLVNHEEQYSLWPKRKQIPEGWRSAGKEGSKADCLQYVKEVWTDMRPLSLRKKIPEVSNASSRTESSA
jgi:MbtH protein